MKKNRIKPLWVLAAATALLMAGGCANPLLTPAVPDIADYLAASPSPEAPTADGDVAVAGAPL